MEKLLLLSILIIVSSCNINPRLSGTLKGNITNYQIKSIGKMIDSTFTDLTDINSLVDFKVIDTKGNIESVDLQTILKTYKSNMENESCATYPIFEIKNSNKVILPVFGQGLWDKIWGHVMINKTTMEVVKIEFDHKGETPGIGGNIRDSSFTIQFIGSKVDLVKNTYSLYQDDSIKVQGIQRIDGISGATITSKGTIQMLNNDLIKYEKYFY